MVAEKSALAILQLRLHCPQKKQAPLSVVLSIFLVRIESLEGITFTPRGDMLISNEAGDKMGNADILIFNYQKKGP